ncbi:MAG: hypothetical protein RLP44_12210 [Aggregatilineales bacterium]
MLEEIYDFEFEVNNLQFSPNDQFIAVYQAKPGGQWGMRLIDLNSGRMVSIVSWGVTNVISGYDFSDDGRYIALATLDRYHEIGQFSGVTIWDTLTGHRVAMKHVLGFVSDVNFSSDNEVTLVRHYYGTDATVFVWQFIGNSSFRRRFSVHMLSDNLNDFSLNESVNYLFGVVVNDWNGVRDRSVYVWNLTTGEELVHVYTPDQYSDMVAVTSSGTRIANTSSVDSERRVDIWDVERGEQVSFFLND